jgi:hypothetical protein
VSILEFISSIAWPLTVLVIVFLLRGALSEMLSGPLRRLRVGPAEAVWQDVELEVKADLSRDSTSLSRSAVNGVAEVELVSSDLATLADRYPPAAVLEGYERVRTTLLGVLEDQPLETEHDLERLSPTALARIALENERINAKTFQAVEGLSVLRNLVAHGDGGEISKEKALDYLVLVDGTLFAIRMNHSQMANSKQP